MARLPEDRRAAFTAAYRFYEEHWDMPDTVDAWTDAARDMKDISSANGNTPLITNLLSALHQTIDEENREARKVLNEALYGTA